MGVREEFEWNDGFPFLVFSLNNKNNLRLIDMEPKLNEDTLFQQSECC